MGEGGRGDGRRGGTPTITVEGTHTHTRLTFNSYSSIKQSAFNKVFKGTAMTAINTATNIHTLRYM